MTEQDYIAYFETLARQHVAIRHSDSEAHFFVDSDENQAEIMAALRSQLRLPALLLDPYRDRYNTAADNFRRTVLGGFTILIKSQKGNPADKRRAREEARAIAKSILIRMRQDILSPAGALYGKRIRLDTTFEGDPAPYVLENADGWGYGIEWEMPTPMAVDPADWLDAD